MNLLRHDHIPVDAEFETAAHTFQPGLKYLLGYGSREPGTAMLAEERHEVSLPGRLESFQSPGHKTSLRLRKSPLKPKNGLSAPPADTLINHPPILSSFRRLSRIKQSQAPRRDLHESSCSSRCGTVSLADPQYKKTKTLRGFEEECPVILQQCGAVTPSRLARRPDQRHTNGLRHSVEDHHALAGALGL